MGLGWQCRAGGDPAHRHVRVNAPRLPSMELRANSAVYSDVFSHNTTGTRSVTILTQTKEPFTYLSSRDECSPTSSALDGRC